MKIKHYTLPEHALSGQRQLTHFHFGEPGRGEKNLSPGGTARR